MIDLYKLSIEELEAVVKTEDWMLALLTDPTLETRRKDAINWHEINYIQDHYTDQGQLHPWSTDDCSARQMYTKHPWPNAEYVRYERYAGEVVMVRIDGDYWIDIWVAASKCISEYHAKYGEDNHRFIEGVCLFNGVVHMSTGS